MDVCEVDFDAFGMYDMGFRTTHFHALCMQNVRDIFKTLVVEKNYIQTRKKIRKWVKLLQGSVPGPICIRFSMLAVVHVKVLKMY